MGVGRGVWGWGRKLTQAFSQHQGTAPGKDEESCVSKWQFRKHANKQGGEVSKSVNKSATYCVNIKYVTVQ